jgi:hypothetical protein
VFTEKQNGYTEATTNSVISNGSEAQKEPKVMGIYILTVRDIYTTVYAVVF